MKMGLTGSHGIGKSTLITELKKDGYNVIDEIARDKIEKEGVLPQNMNENELCEFQFDLLKQQIRKESILKDFVGDRTVIDVLAYSEGLPIYNKLFDLVLEYIKTKPYDIIGYIPVEFPIENDGLRFEGEDFRQVIDKRIVNILNIMSKYINTIVVSGNIPNRLNIITKNINGTI